VKLNCTAIPSELFESELFGYDEGAFTGARKGGKKGQFELADGGTIFLDEISEMPMEMQAKLLRVIQEKEFLSVGGEEPVKTDVRIIAATNRNLRQLVSEGKFRADLFYRLSVIDIHLPPLNQRKEDIPAMVKLFLNQLNNEYRKNLSLSEAIIGRFQSHDWPGNVRELRNAIEKLFALTDGNGPVEDFNDDYYFESGTPEGTTYEAAGEAAEAAEGAADRTLAISGAGSAEPAATHAGPRKTPGVYEELPGTLREKMDRYEKRVLLETLGRHGGNIRQAANELGIHRTLFYKKLEKFGIRPVAARGQLMP
jgi:transcriptional regulator with PAS, ATPase and Fis domain